jgi:hypothetical protein
VGLDPVGQVVGIAAGFVRPGYVRWADRWGRAVVPGASGGSRATKPAEGEGADAVIRFTGTAVRIDQWRRRKAPLVLVLGTVTEVAVMLRCGIEPLGIVGGVGRIELRPSETTMRAPRRTGYSAPNAELEDVTHSIYMVRA